MWTRYLWPVWVSAHQACPIALNHTILSVHRLLSITNNPIDIVLQLELFFLQKVSLRIFVWVGFLRPDAQLDWTFLDKEQAGLTKALQYNALAFAVFHRLYETHKAATVGFRPRFEYGSLAQELDPLVIHLVHDGREVLLEVFARHSHQHTVAQGTHTTGTSLVKCADSNITEHLASMMSANLAHNHACD